MGFVSDGFPCDESTFFLKKEIREKKQFIRDFIRNIDSLNVTLSKEYNSFRLRSGFKSEYCELMQIDRMQQQFIPFIKGFYYFSYSGKAISQGSVNTLMHIISVKFFNSPFGDGYSPEIVFLWYCKNDEWVLVDIQFEIGAHRSYGGETNMDYENW